jgi:hypothetical protein
MHELRGRRACVLEGGRVDEDEGAYPARIDRCYLLSSSGRHPVWDGHEAVYLEFRARVARYHRCHPHAKFIWSLVDRPYHDFILDLDLLTHLFMLRCTPFISPVRNGIFTLVPYALSTVNAQATVFWSLIHRQRLQQFNRIPDKNTNKMSPTSIH